MQLNIYLYIQYINQYVYIYSHIFIWYPPPKTYRFYISAGIYSVFCYFSPIFFWHYFSCHFWLPPKYQEFAIKCN